MTLVAADGRVLGDSAETLEAVAAMENHADRPEIVAAQRKPASARARRYSDTLGIDMLYVAVPVRRGDIAFVRVALPFSDIRQQLGDRPHRDARRAGDCPRRLRRPRLPHDAPAGPPRRAPSPKRRGATAAAT